MECHDRPRVALIAERHGSDAQVLVAVLRCRKGKRLTVEQARFRPARDSVALVGRPVVAAGTPLKRVSVSSRTQLEEYSVV